MYAEIVGSCYIVFGFCGVFANFLIAYLMLSDKSMKRHATYIFMINLAVADATVLSSIAFYAGIHCIMPHINEIVDRIMAWIVAIGWYPGCIFFVIIAFSRWVAISKQEKLKVYFTKNIVAVCIIVPWLASSLFYTCFLFYPKTLFVWYPAYLSWGFDEDSSHFGYFLHKQNTMTNIIFALAQMYFNIRTIVWLRKTRREMLTLRESKNRAREVKLFVQCFLTSCIFCVAAVLYALFYALKGYASPFHFLMMHAAWILHHSVNPIIYFVMNAKLRRLLFCKLSFMIRRKSLSSTNGYAVANHSITTENN